MTQRDWQRGQDIQMIGMQTVTQTFVSGSRKVNQNVQKQSISVIWLLRSGSSQVTKLLQCIPCHRQSVFGNRVPRSVAIGCEDTEDGISKLLMYSIPWLTSLFCISAEGLGFGAFRVFFILFYFLHHDKYKIVLIKKKTFKADRSGTGVMILLSTVNTFHCIMVQRYKRCTMLR